MAAAGAKPSNLSHPPVAFVHDEQNTGTPTVTLPIPTSSLRIVSAAYKEGPTGLTLFLFPNKKSWGAVDVTGGSPGHLFPQDGAVEAIVLSGGSLLGLESGTGVSAELWKSRGFNSGWAHIPLVRGAIIFDYTARDNSFYPDHALGRAAAAAAIAMPKKDTNTFFLGQAGAGYSATCGKSLLSAEKKLAYCEFAGQGAGFRLLGKRPTATIASGPENDVWIACFVVCNAVGHIVDHNGKTVRGHVDPAVVDAGLPVTAETKRLSTPELVNYMKDGVQIEQLLAPFSEPRAKPDVVPSTNISLVVTNLKLGPELVSQLGKQIHASMARGVQPIANVFDGDQLWCVTTNEVEQSVELGTDFGTTALGIAGGEAMWDAILNCYN